MSSRRDFLKRSGLAAAALMTIPRGIFSATTAFGGSKIIKAVRLLEGDTVGLIAPASQVNPPDDVAFSKEVFEALGYRVKIGEHVLDRFGDLAGEDQARADDIHNFVSDPQVKAIVCIRGGWGCQRILPYLDYKLIANNPKIFIGYSDVTTLINAIYAKTGLVTFHGPVGISTFNEFTINSFRDMLAKGDIPAALSNPPKSEKDLVETENRIIRLYPGKVEGRLIGGNLSLMTAMVGTPYEPDYEGAILFLEEVGEKTYSIDRMFSHLKLVGNLKKLNGIVIGKFTDCKPGEGYGAFSIEELLRQYIEPLKIPAYSGAMIGHIKDKWTVPIGVKAELDADLGQIRLLESTVA